MYPSNHPKGLLSQPLTVGHLLILLALATVLVGSAMISSSLMDRTAANEWEAKSRVNELLTQQIRTEWQQLKETVTLVGAAVTAAESTVSAHTKESAAGALALADANAYPSSSKPRAISTMVSLPYCEPAWVLFKSIRAVDPNIDFVVMRPETTSMESLQGHYACKALMDPVQAPGVVWVTAPHQELPKGTQIGQTNWGVSMDKLFAFSLSQYSAMMFMDADTLLIAPPEEYFATLGDSDFVGVTDQWDGCSRREVLNGGLLVFRPSFQMHRIIVTQLMESESCLSGNWRWSDQEVFNCMCGLASPASFKHKRHDVRCRLLPYNWGTSPNALGCREYRSEDIRAIHFAGGGKPWDYPEKPDDNELAKMWRCVLKEPLGVKCQWPRPKQ